jgi:membrane protein YqaA with SNARE-associated domain
LGALEALLSPEGGLLGLAAASFLAATLVPLPSEAALVAYLKLNPQYTALAIAIATLGNTAGGMTSYLLGRLVPERTKYADALYTVSHDRSSTAGLVFVVVPVFLAVIGGAAYGLLLLSHLHAQKQWRR